jgi:hypothetical protein
MYCSNVFPYMGKGVTTLDLGLLLKQRLTRARVKKEA